MAESDRQTSDSLTAEMVQRPYAFNFFQAVRLLHRLDAGRAERGGRRTGAPRYQAHRYAGHPAARMDSYQPGSESE